MDKPASPERGRAQLLDGIRKEIASLTEAKNTVSSEPDQMKIRRVESFASLAPEEQRAFIALAEEKGWPIPDTTPSYKKRSATVLTDESPSDPAVFDARERREEKRERPKTWLFREYRLATDNEGELRIEEDRKRWNEGRGQYDEQDIPTAIVIPEKLREEIARDGSAADGLLAFCNGTRRMLDVCGVKIFIDRPERNPGKIYAKWKYVVDGRKFQDQIRLNDLPKEITDLVRNDFEYYKKEPWNAWFGPAMQQKREAVISAELGRRYGETPCEDFVAAVARAENEPTASAESAADVALRAEEPTEEELCAILAGRAELVAGQFERLITLPEDAGKFVTHVVSFTGSLFAQDFKQGLPQEKVEAVIRDVLRACYRSRAEVIAAIDGTTACEPVTVVSVTEERAAGPESQRDAGPQGPSEDEVRQNEKIVAKAYGTLRGEMLRLSTVGALDTYVQTLEAIAKSGRPDASAGARRLLAHIDSGIAGPLSEERKTACVRTEQEKKFFKKHPSLDARNFRLNEEGHVTAAVEPGDEESSLRRAMCRIVNAAFSVHGIADADVAERITGFTVGIVVGRNRNAQMRQSFTEKLAALDGQKNELTVKNLDALALTLAGLAEKLRVADKG
jgi:hypothetical protein